MIVVTHRKLCKDNFLSRIEEIVKEHPTAILLREKDLNEQAYYQLAKACQQITNVYQIPLIVHSYYELASALNNECIHMSFKDFCENKDYVQHFRWKSVSVHSKEEAIKAEKYGATCLIAGHIFDTDCKLGVPGRGVDYLQEIVQSVHIPVFGIGGIVSGDHVQSVLDTGAQGVCVMSQMMTESVEDVSNKLRVI